MRRYSESIVDHMTITAKAATRTPNMIQCSVLNCCHVARVTPKVIAIAKRRSLTTPDLIAPAYMRSMPNRLSPTRFNTAVPKASTFLTLVADSILVNTIGLKKKCRSDAYFFMHQFCHDRIHGMDTLSAACRSLRRQKRYTIG